MNKLHSDIPPTYVSVSTSSVTHTRKWRVIHHGTPLCADRQTAEEALEVYKAFILSKPAQRMPMAIPLWDGDSATWDTLRNV